MPEYLYVFGYETPNQRRNNAEHGWDEEDCGVVFIVADSEQEALEWGDRVAEAFVRVLYDDPNETWNRSLYAAGIECPSNFTKEQLQDIPHVNYGEFPNLQEMAKRS
jgi:hypothetical protein